MWSIVLLYPASDYTTMLLPWPVQQLQWQKTIKNIFRNKQKGITMARDAAFAAAILFDQLELIRTNLRAAGAIFQTVLTKAIGVSIQGKQTINCLYFQCCYSFLGAIWD